MVCALPLSFWTQCDVDFSFPEGVSFGISPDALAGETFKVGEIWGNYADTIHMLIPLDATELVGAPLAIDSIVVQSISLTGESGESLLISDVGLELTPNNNEDSPNPFTFMGGEQYCATLTGIPDTTGVFQASIDVEGWSNFLGNPISQPVSFDGYTLTINPEPGPGCTEPEACNYVSNATSDDGSCLYPDVAGVCGGDCTADEDSDGICDDIDECVGYFDACGACNGPGPIFECGCWDIPEGDCDCEGNFPDAIGSCGGDCVADANGNGICDDNEVFGCTYAFAVNYNSVSTQDDGSCLFAGCTDPSATNYEPLASVNDGSCNSEPCDDGLTSNMGDLNGDGFVGAGDLLQFLAVFGTTYIN